MVFSSALFLFVFLPLFLIFTIIAARIVEKGHSTLLVLFSFIFYIIGGGLYTAILFASVIFNFFFAKALEKNDQTDTLLALGVSVNFLPLLFFKYLGFLADAADYLFLRSPLQGQVPNIELFLPIGISFYTFQAISYLIDVKRGDTKAETRLTTFAAYMVMFPQLVAGPIVRYLEVRADLSKRQITPMGLHAGLFFFGVGLAKKLLVADVIAIRVDEIYALPADEITGLMAWLAAIGYHIQIFFDFSGYSEMAIGIGLMIGLSLPENFRQPYRATSITDFWRRWHLTLSRWFRDYLYIPLGGNRAGMVRTLLNLVIVFTLCGLWHGAAVTFLIWGLYHGLLLVVERVLSRRLNVRPSGALGFVVTSFLVIFGWVYFRATSIEQANSMVSKMLYFDRSGESIFGLGYFLTPQIVFTLIVGISFALIPSETWRVREKLMSRNSIAAGFCGLVLVAVSSFALIANGFNPFIYFQF